MLSRLRHFEAALVNAAKESLSNRPYCPPSLSCSEQMELSLIPHSGDETAELLPPLSEHQEAERLSFLLISGSRSTVFLPFLSLAASLLGCSRAFVNIFSSMNIFCGCM